MLMNDLSNIRLLTLLSEPSQTVINEEMQTAYGNLLNI